MGAAAGGTTPAFRAGPEPGLAPPAPTTITVSIMDMVVPTIPEVTADNIELKMSYPTLTKCEDAPTYSTMSTICEEIFRNAIAVKSTFRGGKHGHYDSLQNPAGEPWTVPKTGGVYPTFAAGMNDAEKKREVATFILTEHNIKKAEVTQDLFKKQFLEAFPKDYYLDLNAVILRYESSTVYDLLTHVFTNYAKLNNHLVISNKKEFEEAQDFTRPVDAYYKRMEDCQKLEADGEVPITEAKMAVQLQTHIGATGMMNGNYLKWKTKPLNKRGWKPAKIWFCDALNNVDEINNLTAGKAGLTTNATVKRSNSESLICQKMQRDLVESFGTLAMAAVAKNETFDLLTKSISDLTAANAKLTGSNAEISAAVKKLTNQLEEALKGRDSSNTHTINTSSNGSNWTNWCDPGAYCHTCGYKLRKGHNSKNCPRAKDNPDHKLEATRRNPMGDICINCGFGNTPNGK